MATAMEKWLRSQLGGSDLSDEALAMNVQRARAKREAKDRAKRGLASTTGAKLFDSTRMFAPNAVRYSDAEVEAQVRRTARQLTNAYGSRNSASGMSHSSSTGSRQPLFSAEQIQRMTFERRHESGRSGTRRQALKSRGARKSAATQSQGSRESSRPRRKKAEAALVSHRNQVSAGATDAGRVSAQSHSSAATSGARFAALQASMSRTQNAQRSQEMSGELATRARRVSPSSYRTTGRAGTNFSQAPTSLQESSRHSAESLPLSPVQESARSRARSMSSGSASVPRTPFAALVINDYSASKRTEMTVKCGDVLRIVDTVSSQVWWKAENSAGLQGFVPRGCVVFDESDDGAQIGSMRSVSPYNRPATGSGHSASQRQTRQSRITPTLQRDTRRNGSATSPSSGSRDFDSSARANGDSSALAHSSSISPTNSEPLSRVRSFNGRNTWSQYTSDEGERFWVNDTSGEQVRHRPPRSEVLRKLYINEIWWEEHLDPTTSCTYWYNTNSGATQWGEPDPDNGKPVSPRKVTAPSCIVCMDNPSCIALVPCWHVCLCQNCASNLSQCPQCKLPIRERQRIYI